MNNLPPPLRTQLAADPTYKVCLRNAILKDHVCAPNPLNRQLIEWEHAIIFASKQVQKRWAIIPICWWAHSGPGLVKEINVWLALNRATDEELQEVSRVIDYVRRRRVLNEKYGEVVISQRD